MTHTHSPTSSRWISRLAFGVAACVAAFGLGPLASADVGSSGRLDAVRSLNGTICTAGMTNVDAGAWSSSNFGSGSGVSFEQSWTIYDDGRIEVYGYVCDDEDTFSTSTEAPALGGYDCYTSLDWFIHDPWETEAGVWVYMVTTPGSTGGQGYQDSGIGSLDGMASMELEEEGWLTFSVSGWWVFDGDGSATVLWSFEGDN